MPLLLSDYGDSNVRRVSGKRLAGHGIMVAKYWTDSPPRKEGVKYTLLAKAQKRLVQWQSELPS